MSRWSASWDRRSSADPVGLLVQIPSELLRSELVRRHGRDSNAGADRPACGSRSGGPAESYDTGLHVAGLVVILVLSTISCAVPLLAQRIPSVPVPAWFLFWCRHFGTGVLLATAFVHLLPTAFVSLTDPCLPPFWNESFPAMPGAIALSAVFVVVGIEMYFAIKGGGHSHCHGPDGLLNSTRNKSESDVSGRRPRVTVVVHNDDDGNDDSDDVDGTDERDIGSSSQPGRTRGRRPSLLSGDGDALDQPFLFQHKHRRLYSGRDGGLFSPDTADKTDDADTIPLTLLSGASRPARPTGDGEHGDGPAREEAEADQGRDRDTLQVVLLEAGILFHSVFIGLSLSVTTGTTSYIVLLLAISMHQTFEGLALGSRIAAIRFAPSSARLDDRLDGWPHRARTVLRRWQPWLMCVAFGITTPIGQAIGLAVHNLYDPAGQTGLITVGCTNAVSSGFLLFAGLVSLLAEDFLTERSYESLTGGRRRQACMCVVAGAFAMAIVGIWA